MSQRDFYFLDQSAKLVRGYVYIGEKRLRPKLDTFEGAALDDQGRLIDRTARGKKRFESLVLRLHRQEEKRLLEQEEKRNLKAKSIKQLMGEWIELSEGSKKPKTLAHYRLMKWQYLEAVKDHDLAEPDPVSRLRRYPLRCADKFLLYCRRRKMSVASERIRLSTLATFLTWAFERGELDQRPRIKLPPKEKKIPRTLTDDQLVDLFDLISAKIALTKNRRHRRAYMLHQRFAMVAAATGRRLSEIHSRKWSHFDLNAGILTIDHQREADGDGLDFTVKNRTENRIMLPRTLVAFLKRVQGKDEVYLMDNGKGKLAMGRHALTTAFMRHISGPIQKPDEKLSGKHGLGIKGVKATHCFRAGWITDMFKMGIDLETIRRGAGHKHLSVTMGYISEPDAHVKDAVRKYDKLFGQKLSKRKLIAM